MKHVNIVHLYAKEMNIYGDNGNVLVLKQRLAWRQINSKIILYLKNQGIGILITDHNVRETLGITDRAYIMTEGKILRSGAPAELVEDADVRRLYLGERFSL